MLWGYFKKLVIADRLAIYVNAVYNNSEHHNGTSFIVATIFFAFQIYADFSGYTDIALGSARLFGFNLTNNFKRPYFATSIKEFWNRWHITFSTWLRDYIFLPLAYFLSNRMKKQKYLHIASEKWIYLIAIIVTFVICGIWHGVGWTYLIWGVLFGLYLADSNWTKDFYKKVRKRLNIKKASPYYITFKILSTFIMVLFAWVFFRADSLSTAFYIIKSVFTASGNFFIDYKTFVYGLAGILILIYVEYCREFRTESSLPFVTNHWIKEALLYGSLIIIILLVGVFDGSQFIYFQY
jgi:D-alanyl-lipoteichoic acid acyltransferase DltB (MBOAT superfamily)